MTTESRAHAKYSFSGAYRWMSCTASARLSATVPESPSDKYAQLGTAAHEAFETCLRARLTEADCFLGVSMSNGVILEANDIGAVNDGLDYVYDILAMDTEAQLFIENDVRLAGFEEICGGHADVVIYLPTWKIVYVLDYKHGEGMPVEVRNNPQFQGYAICSADTLKLPPPGEAQYMIGVIQPRIDHPKGAVRVLPVDAPVLIAFRAMVEASIRDGEEGSGTYAPTPENCRYCPAAAICRFAENAALEPIGLTSYDMATRSALTPIESMDAIRVSKALQALNLAKSLQKAVYSRAMAMARAGIYVPGFKLVESQRRRVWHGDPLAVAEKLCELSGVNDLDLFYPRSLVGIVDAEDKLKALYKGNAKRGSKRTAATQAIQDMALLTVKESSGELTLVSEDSGRDAVTPKAAFSGIKPMIPQNL